ncbi:hypothetical protein HBH79_243060 [Parastagonospora nodorum]|nr:hypothetical protein HBH79_243060 [Parastagonospora nodorum]KAH5399577.1 hypothetical protein HBI46_239920 [Parastagonospora nodorum]KAH5846139.1 hypothetical protein HBI91_223970 [Parastagonospora nodorum]
MWTFAADFAQGRDVQLWRQDPSISAPLSASPSRPVEGLEHIRRPAETHCVPIQANFTDAKQESRTRFTLLKADTPGMPHQNTRRRMPPTEIPGGSTRGPCGLYSISAQLHLHDGGFALVLVDRAHTSRRPAARAASGGPLAWGPHSRTACSPPSRSCAASTTHSMSNCPRPDSLRGQDYAQRRNYEHPRVVYPMFSGSTGGFQVSVLCLLQKRRVLGADGVDLWSVRVLRAGRHYGSGQLRS